MTDFDAALDAMSAKEVERLVEAAQRRLRRCIICSNDGALRVGCRTPHPSKSTFGLLLCPACIQKHRLPARGS